MSGYMSHERIAAIFDLLQQHPRGLTAVEIATALSWPVSSTNTRMSKLYFYGTFDRRPHPESRSYLYQVKAPAPQERQREFA